LLAHDDFSRPFPLKINDRINIRVTGEEEVVVDYGGKTEAGDGVRGNKTGNGSQSHEVGRVRR
jgi:hypothetical protein